MTMTSSAIKHSMRVWQLVMGDTGISLLAAVRGAEAPSRGAKARAAASGALK